MDVRVNTGTIQDKKPQPIARELDPLAFPDISARPRLAPFSLRPIPLPFSLL
jgi:hypothetical protein